MLKHTLCFCFSIPLVLVSFSQSTDINTYDPVVVPASPEAAELGKFGTIPLNESTGTFSFPVPLHNYSAGAIQLPISLSYYSNPVRVNQTSGLYGLNWNLNAGGVISRTVYDLPYSSRARRLPG